MTLPEPHPRRLLSGWGVVLWGVLLQVAILHYATPPHMYWVHDVARRLYYLPILMGGGLGGLRGGLIVAGAVLAIYSPHAWLTWLGHDPGTASQKLLESAFYIVLGIIAGLFAEQQHRQASQLWRRDAALLRASRLQALGALTAGLAHEIRNPLHAMRGTAEIVLDAVPQDAPQRPLTNALLSEIDRLDGVLRRFLDFARHRPPTTEAVVPAEVIEHVAELIRAQAARQSSTVHLDARLTGPIQGDRQQLIQVMLSLCINALQALGEGGNLWLSVIEEGGERGMMVLNDGPPIPAEMREHIFDPFVSSREEGTGLGLAIAWRIVADHGGRLSLVEREDALVGFSVLLSAEAPATR